MDLKVFARKVQEMRNAQKSYFRTRGNAALQEAKRLEKLIDDNVNEILAETEQEDKQLEFDII